jgi:hypothetical protein
MSERIIGTFLLNLIAENGNWCYIWYLQGSRVERNPNNTKILNLNNILCDLL